MKIRFDKYDLAFIVCAVTLIAALNLLECKDSGSVLAAACGLSWSIARGLR